MRLYFNRDNSGAITRDPAVGATLASTDPVLAKRGDSPALQLQFVRAGVPQLPSGPLITFVVKKLKDYAGPAIILADTFTTPGDASGFYTLYPDLTQDSLLEQLFVGPLLAPAANATARHALTAPTVTLGAVVKQTDTGVYWQATDLAQLTTDAGWTTDVSYQDFVDFGAEIVLRESPGFGEESSQSFVFRVQADYERGGETPPPIGSPFGAGLLLNLSQITALTGGGAGHLDGLDTVGGIIAPLTLAFLNLAAGPYIWRLIASPAVTSSSVANPSVITTTTPHGFVTGQTVTIGGHTGSTPDINGDHVVTVTGASTFTIPVDVTVGGSGGFATPTTDTATYGVVRPTDFDAATNAVSWKSVA